MRILVIEDDRDVADVLVARLRREGYAVDAAVDGEEALVKALSYPYDLVCLDLGLPGIDGREVLRRIRSERASPGKAPRILIVTARGARSDRIRGLDDGADDYVVKPFDLDELVARVRALLRRDAGQSGALLEVGDLELDTARMVAKRAGTRLALSPKEFALLRFLMSRPGEVVSEGDLLAHVWDENANPFTNTIRVTVMTLRRKLAACAPGQPIETVVGSGYRLRANG